MKPEVALVVVAERELVVGAGQEAVRLAARVGARAAELLAAVVPAVAGVGVAAALPLGRAERRRVPGGDARVAVVRVRVGAALHGVGVRQPAEVVVEGPVLHHQHDEVVDRHVARGGKLRRERLAAGGLAEEQVQRQRRGGADRAGGVGAAPQEVAAPHRRLGGGGHVALECLSAQPLVLGQLPTHGCPRVTQRHRPINGRLLLLHAAALPVSGSGRRRAAALPTRGAAVRRRTWRSGGSGGPRASAP